VPPYPRKITGKYSNTDNQQVKSKLTGIQNVQLSLSAKLQEMYTEVSFSPML